MKDFTPLRLNQKGLSISELKTLINGRDVYIWGCGHLGRIIKRSLEKNGLPVMAFCDSDPKQVSNDVGGDEVLNPEVVLEYARSNRAFIIIASAQYRDEIEKRCLDADLIKKETFISHIHISRPEVAIDIAGMCNLKCASCPRGNLDSLRPEGYMPAAVYEMLLDKLLREMPFLMNIDLSTWGEPFMNPDIAEIIRLTEKFVSCTVSTNLQLPDNLSDAIMAQPSQLIISAGGYGKSYENNHQGASWNSFVENIYLVKKCIDKYKPKTRFTVLYHLYRDNNEDDLACMRKLCTGAGIKLVTTFGYINPYDKILDFCNGLNIGDNADNVVNQLQWDFKRCLELAKCSAARPCLCQRIFPIINWDLSVALCHTYYNPVIVENYLELPLNEIINIRLNQSQCRFCQNYGLHRLDIEMLLKEHPSGEILKQDTEK